MQSLLLRYRLSLGLFIIGLILSGVTAFPLLTELRILRRLFGITDPAAYQTLTGLPHWLAFVLFGLEQTYAKFPFIGYGTDWLAFGHLCIAVFFIRPWFKPLESDWVLKCGLVCCATRITNPAVPPGARRPSGRCRRGSRSRGSRRRGACRRESRPGP